MAQKEADPRMYRAKVTIAGEQYVVKGDRQPEEIAAVARVVDKYIGDVMRRLPNLPRHQAAILAALHIADEAEKLRREKEELLKMAEEIH